MVIAFAERFARAVSDVTVGTVIVLVHVALADRERAPRALAAIPYTTADGRRIWRGQASP